jgi:hypothetical protein
MPVVLTDVVNLSDVILANNFDLIIPNPPGSNDGSALTIRSLNGTLPGISHPAVPVTLHRCTAHFAGHRTYGGQFSVTFIDSDDGAIMQTLSAWNDLVSDPTTGLPNSKDNYTASAVVIVYDNSMNVYEQRTYQNIWITQQPDMQLDGQADSPLMISAVFAYDMWTPGAFSS